MLTDIYTNKTGATAELRAKALATLAQVPGRVKDTVTLPFKRGVLRGLEAAVGDGKRTVRVEGVDCRSAWEGLAEKVDEDE